MKQAGLLGTLAEHGVAVVFEAPKPIFKAPPFRCADWFNAVNPVCAPGFDIERAEIERLRSPTLASLHELSSALPRSTVWDPLPTLCPGSTCSAFSNGVPLFFDGDHLSAIGNAKLVTPFTDHLRNVAGRDPALAARP